MFQNEKQPNSGLVQRISVICDVSRIILDLRELAITRNNVPAARSVSLKFNFPGLEVNVPYTALEAGIVFVESHFRDVFTSSCHKMFQMK